MKNPGNAGATKLTLLLSSTLTIMSTATIAPSLPQISAVFKEAPHAELLSKLILTSPALLIAMTAMAAGYFLDRFGRKPLFITGLFVYAVAGSAGLFIHSLIQLLISRAVLGLAVAAIMTSVTTLIGDYFQGEERNRIMGLQGATMAFGGVIFIVLGGLLADFSWRGPFAIYLIAALVIPFVLLYIREPKRNIRITAETPGKKEELLLVPVIGILFTGFVGLIVFYMVPVQMPFLLKKLGVDSNLKVGIGIAASTFMGAIVASFYQWFKRKLSFAAIYSLTFGFMAAGFFVIGNAENYESAVIGLLINGIGMGFMMPNGSTWLMKIAPVAVRGRVIGGMTTAVFAGQFLSPIVFAPLISYLGISDSFKMIGLIVTIPCIIFLAINFISERKKVVSVNKI